MPARPIAIVPMKSPATAKLRLAHVLGPPARAALARALSAHVVSVLRAAGLTVVALAPPEVDAPAADERWVERGVGLNEALRGAFARAVGPVLVVPADLPWLTREDVARLLAAPGDLVVVPSEDGGTNALLLRSRVPPAFGPDSALAHAALGHARGLRVTVLPLPSFAEDLDDEPGLIAALGRSPALPPALAERLWDATGGRRRPPVFWSSSG